MDLVPSSTMNDVKRFFGLYGAAKGWLIARLAQKHQRLLICTSDRQTAEDLRTDVEFFLGSAAALMLPGWDTLPFEHVSPQAETSAARLRAIDHLRNHYAGVVIAPADALMQLVLPAQIIAALGFQLTPGTIIQRPQLLERLANAGFRQVSNVAEVGDMAVRGGVVDIFPSTSTKPIRLDFIDDEIESIKTFELDSQRSLDILTRVDVLPLREAVPLRAWISSREELNQCLARVKARGKALETPPREIARALSALRTSSDLPAYELMLPIAFPAFVPLHSYLATDTLVVFDDEQAFLQSIDSFYALIQERAQRLSSEHFLIPQVEHLYLDPDSLHSSLKRHAHYHLDSLEVVSSAGVRSEKAVNLKTSTNAELVTRLKTKVGSGTALTPLKELLERLRRDKYEIAFVVGARPRADRLYRLLLDLSVDAAITEQTGLAWLESKRRPAISILIGNLAHGVQLPTEKVAFIAESEIFSERSHQRVSASRKSLRRIMSSLAQLHEGDFLVHIDFGIGKYLGLRHVEVEQVGGDFLMIQYADTLLYLPVHNIGRVQKFTAAEGQEPQLDKLSSTRWQRTKAKVREAVATLAGDLIKLYAVRSNARGWRFEPRGAEDERFADGFAYSETVDQHKAIEETLDDMAKDTIMDRLVCGDVGFGKTEVALRAAFKCTQHGRQVALLVPTTILVEQHRASFVERFAGYPIEVGALSRFYSPAQNRETLKRLASGQLDIVVGTHKLLSRDVQFKDLGLVIVDEEHRFGVRHKERLKQLKKSVDVLTLTATPIPRTLHMSLLGIRDISVISTPPHDRRSTRTYLATYDKTIVRDAILRELKRGGQCFFLHNRVQSIALTTHELSELVPEARFCFGHGQMEERALEGIMQRFVNKEFDVLVSTTIIESGLDIPNANTIIIDRADTFGLAQLYQLRGRVGRSTRQAYAYLLVPNARKLTADARERLKALQALDDLGVGFNLALRDMEIRGAGNLLGREQSGNVLAVGFDLYTRILKQAIANLKDEELSLEETLDPDVKLGVNAFIPDYYIPDISERLVMYQRLAAIESDQDSQELREEMRDRFGPLGSETDNMIELMRYRALLRRFGVSRAEFKNSRISLAFSPRAPISAERLIELAREKPARYRLSRGLTLGIELGVERLDDIFYAYAVTHEALESVARPAQPNAAC